MLHYNNFIERLRTVLSKNSCTFTSYCSGGKTGRILQNSEEAGSFFYPPPTRKGQVVTRKNGKNGESKSVSFESLDSTLQNYLRHRAPDQNGLTDAEVKAFWSAFTLQNSNPALDLNIPVAAMRRVMRSAVERRKSELKRNRLKLMAGALK
ncbi:MAG: hypothetical protein ABIJ84_02270 [bacterium]